MDTPCYLKEPFPARVIIDISQEIDDYERYIGQLSIADLPIEAILGDMIKCLRFEYAHNSEIIQYMSIVANHTHLTDDDDYKAFVNAFRGLGMGLSTKFKMHGLYDEQGTLHYNFGTLSYDVMVMHRIDKQSALY